MLSADSKKTPVEGEAKLSNSDNAEQSTAKLMTSDEISTPSLQKWTLSNLADEEVRKEQAVRSEVIEQLRKEVEPQVLQQTSLIKKNAYEEAYNKGHDEGFKQGLQAGKLEGKKQALKQAEDALKPQVKSLQNLSEFMCQPYQKISEDVFANLVEMVIKISKKIIKTEITYDSDWIIQVLEEAVAKLPSESKPTELYLNSEDLSVIEAHYDPLNKNWQLFSDDKLQKGTCRVVQEATSLIDDWQVKLEAIMEEIQLTSQTILADEENSTSNQPKEDGLTSTAD